MKSMWFKYVTSGIACLGTMIPTSVVAASGAEVPTSSDIALREGGLLVGQVVNSQGNAVVNAPVSIRYANHEVVRTASDERGVFAARGLRGGQYELLTEQGSSTCRLWAADTAPPSAKPSALLVSGNSMVRGQGAVQNGIGWMKTHPYLTGTAIAAAIAIPIAVSDDDDSGS